MQSITLTREKAFLPQQCVIQVAHSYGKDTESVRWADDLIVLVDEFRKHEWLKAAVDKRLRQELDKLGLTVNEEKSCIIDLRKPKEKIQYLEFEFRRVTAKSRKVWVLETPKPEARINLQRKLKVIFKTKKSRSVNEVVQTINPIIRGWANYFRIGNSAQCFGKFEYWVQKKVRRHIYKQKQRRGFGWKRWSAEQFYHKTGLYRDYKIRYARHTRQ